MSAFWDVTLTCPIPNGLPTERERERELFYFTVPKLLIRKIYHLLFLLTMAHIVTFQNISLFSLDSLYINFGMYAQ
jgi:hypothetical protein